MVGILARQALVDILAELGFSRLELSDDARMHADLELDSTEMVELSLELRRRLGVDVKLDSARDATLGDVCALVEDALEQAGAPRMARLD